MLSRGQYPTKLVENLIIIVNTAQQSVFSLIFAYNFKARFNIYHTSNIIYKSSFKLLGKLKCLNVGS